MVTKCEHRLLSTSTLLSQAGKLEMTNAVFTSLPMFFLCTFLMHKTINKQVDKYRKHNLWRDGNVNAKNPPKAAWEMVCLPKSEGGLGVLNLETQNMALLLKYLDKFFNKADIPWVHMIWEKYYKNGKLPNHTPKGSFRWRNVLKLLDRYKGLAIVAMEDDSTCNLWHDFWGGMVPQQSFPELYSFAKKTNIRVKASKEISDLEQLFHLPLAAIAFEQLQVLLNALESAGNLHGNDTWTYIWGSPLFTSAKAYKQLTGTAPTHPSFA